jgi:hypothetical protein
MIIFERSDEGTTYYEVASKEVGTLGTQVNLPDAVLIGLGTAAQSAAAWACYTYGAVTGQAFGASGDSLFRRGDANADGATDISDAAAILNYLFLGVDKVPCEQAGDANDDGRLNIADPVYVLRFLFMGGNAIPPPVGSCGLDPTGHSLPCASFPICQ